MGGYRMGIFWGTTMIYSGVQLLMAAVIIVWYLKTVLYLGMEGVPVPLVHFVQLLWKLVTMCGRPNNIDGRKLFSSIYLEWESFLWYFDFFWSNSRRRRMEGLEFTLYSQIHFSDFGSFYFWPFFTPPPTIGSQRDWLLCAIIFTIGTHFDQFFGLFKKRYLHSFLLKEVLYFYPKL